ncbi:MAG: hypothetical protein K1X89_21670 [Myxococcaceae bacterium]|nr:hypothetical protein [Myxococcaceae bacterium]
MSLNVRLSFAVAASCALFACGPMEATVSGEDGENDAVTSNLGGTWKLEGLDVKYLGYIAAFDKETYMDDLKSNPNVSHNWFRIQAMSAAVTQLLKSANPLPPTSFTASSWQTYLQGKQYRGVSHVWGQSVTCVDGKVTARTTPSEEWSGGYTPELGKFVSGEAWTSTAGFTTGLTSELTQGGTCVKATAKHASRINETMRRLGKVAFDFDAPFIWTIVTSEVCCTKTQTVTIDSSAFPSHSLYLGDRLIRDVEQSGFSAFIVAGGKELHPQGTGPFAPAGARLSYRMTPTVR